jgi:hypothetical protein
VQWSDGVASNPRLLTATTGALTFKAEYNCSTSGSSSSSATTSTNAVAEFPIASLAVIILAILIVVAVVSRKLPEKKTN